MVSLWKKKTTTKTVVSITTVETDTLGSAALFFSDLFTDLAETIYNGPSW